MLYIDAQRAKTLSLWNQLPNEYKNAIVRATEQGYRYVKVDGKFMMIDTERNLKELGYYVYDNRLNVENEYEIRW